MWDRLLGPIILNTNILCGTDYFKMWDRLF